MKNESAKFKEEWRGGCVEGDVFGVWGVGKKVTTPPQNTEDKATLKVEIPKPNYKWKHCTLKR